jgi:hypothetical protein
MAGIGAFIKERQADGLADPEILVEVLRKFPDAKTTLNSVRWYRSNANKEGGRTKDARERAPEARRAAPRAKAKAKGPIEELDDSIPGMMRVDGKDLKPGMRGFYYIDGIKTFAGREGKGYNANLYAGGAKVAEVIDEGSGGAPLYHWLDQGAERVAVEVRDWQGEIETRKVTPLEAHWLRHVADLPKELQRDHPGETTHVDPDTHLAQIVDECLVARRLRRLMNGHLVFLAGGKLMQYKLTGTTLVKAVKELRSRHPDLAILNEMPMAEAVRLVV